MSGRAGRRGKDDRGEGLSPHCQSNEYHFRITFQLGKHHPVAACTTCLVADSERKTSCTAVAGIVILMLDSKMEPTVAKNMVKGAPDTLHSEFRLGYSMLLNMMRGEGRIDARDLLAASYKQFQVERALPALRQKIQDLQVCHPPPDPRQVLDRVLEIQRHKKCNKPLALAGGADKLSLCAFQNGIFFYLYASRAVRQVSSPSRSHERSSSWSKPQLLGVSSAGAA